MSLSKCSDSYDSSCSGLSGTVFHVKRDLLTTILQKTRLKIGGGWLLDVFGFFVFFIFYFLFFWSGIILLASKLIISSEQNQYFSKEKKPNNDWESSARNWFKLFLPKSEKTRSYRNWILNLKSQQKFSSKRGGNLDQHIWGKKSS